VTDVTPAADRHPLDDAGWRAMTSYQAHLAEGAGRARRFRPDVSVFAAVEADDADAWADLATLVGPGSTAVLLGPPVRALPPGWAVDRVLPASQMVAAGPLPAAGATPPDGVILRGLTPADVDEVLALVALTEPGPFARRTIEMGRYRGLFDDADGRLVAMAGERMHLPGFTEVSGVCTDPSARGRGLAAHLTALVVRGVVARGETAFLHVAEGNPARRVYERLGFTVRRPVEATIMTAVAVAARR
jgi:GNAT superfamily N-acetyltransferase